MSALEPAAFYTGIVADAYAALRSASVDPDRYARFVLDHGEPALELGCGDGHPLLDLVARGLDVTGLDSSADMLRRCRAFAQARRLQVDLVCQPMQEMRLGRTFASIYIAGPTFNLLPDDAAGQRALRAIGDHLMADGAALVPLWIPGPTPVADLGVAREAVDDGVLLRYTPLAETYDENTRTRVTAARYERVRPDGRVDVADRDWVLHWWDAEAFTALCARAGVELRELEVSDDGTKLTAVVGR